MDEIFASDSVRRQLKRRGVTPDTIESQLSQFRRGRITVDLLRPATISDGIVKLGKTEEQKYIDIYDNALHSLDVVKFVPASGAASRMFRDLLSEYSELKANENPEIGKYEFSRKLIENLPNFAFHDELKSLCDTSEVKEVLETLLFEQGLNYSNLPKGLIKFHKYPGSIRTAFEAQLAEASEYISDRSGHCNIHFTVPQEHKNKIEQYLNERLSEYEKEDLKFHLTYSVQNPATDTIAVDAENRPVTDKNGKLLFRPAGHGALIGNLNQIDSDIVFIKNIDNITTEKYLAETIKYKKVLGGYLVSIIEKIRNILLLIEETDIGNELNNKISEFYGNELGMEFPEKLNPGLVKGFLNRPVRVCGVVKNVGEPGGGPFWISRDGKISKQIVESAQVDMKDKSQESIWSSSTHFNPVDIVCSVRDYKGEKFDLEGYIDRNAGIITDKSIDGKKIKALELPGLWNGAMADWITVFVEVPRITFNPVKSVFDLLRKEHQG